MSGSLTEAPFKDSRGRTIQLRKLSVMEQVRLLRAIGPDQASNKPYTDLVNMAAMVDSIDDIPMPMPINERQIDRSIEMLGDEGFAAVQSRFVQAIKEIQDKADAAVGLKSGDPFSPTPAPLPTTSESPNS